MYSAIIASGDFIDHGLLLHLQLGILEYPWSDCRFRCQKCFLKQWLGRDGGVVRKEVELVKSEVSVGLVCFFDELEKVSDWYFLIKPTLIFSLKFVFIFSESQVPCNRGYHRIYRANVLRIVANKIQRQAQWQGQRWYHYAKTCHSNIVRDYFLCTDWCLTSYPSC